MPWVTIWQWSSAATTTQGSRANFTDRQVISASSFSWFGIQARVTLTDFVGGNSIDEAFIGQSPSAPTHIWDFDGNQQQLLWSGSSSISGISSLGSLSDATTVTLTSSLKVVVALHMPSSDGSNNTVANQGTNNSTGYEHSATNDSSNTSPAGYAAAANGVFFVSKVEIFQPDPVPGPIDIWIKTKSVMVSY